MFTREEPNRGSVAGDSGYTMKHLLDKVIPYLSKKYKVNESLSKKRMNEDLSSLNDFLDELKNGCGTKKEADALYRKAKETLGKGDFGLFVKEYAQTRNSLSESKKRMNEDYDSLLNHFGISRREIGLSVDENGDLVVVADFTASPKKLKEYAYVLDSLANEYSK